MIPAATPRFHGHRTLGGPSAARLRLLAGVERDKPAHVLERLRDETARSLPTYVSRTDLAGRALVVRWDAVATIGNVRVPPLCSNARWEARR